MGRAPNDDGAPVQNGENLQETKESAATDLYSRHLHWANTERAYVAASRRTNRSLEARLESVMRASSIHHQLTGMRLRIIEETVLNQQPYEEETEEEKDDTDDDDDDDDDDLPQSYRAFHPELTSDPASGGNASLALHLACLDKRWNQSPTNQLYAHRFSGSSTTTCRWSAVSCLAAFARSIFSDATVMVLMKSWDRQTGQETSWDMPVTPTSHQF